MVSEAESVNYEKIKSESPPPIYPPLEQSMSPQGDSMKDLTLSPSSKQNSIMSLTLDEFQSKSGKSFGSMNMDEFLNNIWGVEGDQLSLQSNHSHEPTIDKTLANQSSLPRQSSFSISSPLCKKTVDEVWFEIQRDRSQQQNLRNISSRDSLQRQKTFAEMTLEDFLVKAGVVQEASVLSQPRTMESTHNDIGNYQNENSCLDANIGMGRASSLGYSDCQNHGNTMPNNGFTPYEMVTETNIPMRESSNNFDNEDSGGAMGSSGKKSKKGRSLDGPTEEAIERRQRRMIKNRESAARSRARKQAYTVELELELTQLKEENEKLKQTVADVEKKRKHEQLMMRRLYTTKAQKKIAEQMRTIKRSMSMHW